MKKILRICLVLFGITIVLAAAAYFTATNGSFQKWIISKQLPSGSEIQEVRVTPSRANLSGLVLALEDGTRVRLESAEVDYSLRAAVFSKTIRVSQLTVSGLVIRMGTVQEMKAERKESAPMEPEKMLDLLYGIAEGGWRFDIAQLDLGGELIDTSDRSYLASVKSSGIAPDSESEIRFSLKLTGVAEAVTGLATLDGTSVVRLHQLSNGGFDRLNVEASASGTDSAGRSLLDLKKTFALEVDPEARTSAAEFTFALDWPQPEVFAPELAALGAVRLNMNGSARTSGDAVDLNELSATGSTGGSEVLRLDLLQPLHIGTDLAVSGELLRLTLTDLPLSWVNPWLPEGVRIFGSPLRARLTLQSSDDGGFVLQAPEAVQLGPLSVLQNDSPLLRDVGVTLFPRLVLKPDRSVDVLLSELTISTPAGTLLAGTVKGTLARDTGTAVGLGEFNGSLGPLFSQPLLTGKTGIADGLYQLKIDLDAGATTSLNASGTLSRLRSANSTQPLPDVRFSVKLSGSADQPWSMNTLVDAAIAGGVSNDLRLSGTVDARQSPPLFKLDLQSKRLSVADLSALGTAFAPAGKTTAPAPSGPGTIREEPDTPPWAGAAGTFAVSVDSLVLESGAVVERIRASGRVGEPGLVLEQFRADLGSGAVEGKAAINFEKGRARPYTATAAVDASGIEAAFFRGTATSFPVSGQFDGLVRLDGNGRTLEEAIDGLQGQIRVSGREGVVTAFELNQQSELGLVGAGVLGAALNRPGITAMTQVVPYFKDIRFSDFLLELGRGADQRVNLSALRILGEYLRIEGSGSLEATSLRNALKAPLDLTLALAAKGPLAGYLDQLKLLEPTAGADGFRNWSRTLKIAGTLQDPDTSALGSILTRAATSAIEKPAPAAQAQPGATQAPEGSQQQLIQPESPPPTKEEKRAKDIEQGIKLIESLF